MADAAWFLAVATPVVFGCGSQVDYGALTSAASGQGGQFTFVTGPGGGDGGSTRTPPVRPPPPPDVNDPGCTEHLPPQENYTCDPFKPSMSGCLPEEACQIYVEYPSMPCGQERYGSVCGPAGPGKQGDPCAGGQDCGGGHVCVVTGSGTQCVQLCKVSGPSGCAAGLICEPIDVKGFGGCL